MIRRKAREAAFFLLFEAKFHKEKDIDEIYEMAKTARGMEDDCYVRKTITGVTAHRDVLDVLIEKHSHGWKKSRISPVSLTLMEIAVYEMRFCDDIPFTVSINEALELVKIYDDENARAFVNGVLNAIAKEAEASGHAE